MKQIVGSLAVSLLACPASAQIELKHFWDFEAADLGKDSAGGVDGSITDPTTLASRVGHSESSTAVEFQSEISGVDDIIALDGTSLFQPGNSPFSISFWFKMPDDSTTAPRGIFDFSSNGGSGPQSLYIGTTGELAFRIDFSAGGVALVKIALNLEDDEWHFVVATYDPTSGLEVHLDGFGVDENSPTTGDVPFASDSYFGTFNFTASTEAKGLGGFLDDFAVFSGKLEEAEITSLFEKSASPLDFLPIDPESILEITSVVRSPDANVIIWPSLEGTTYSIWESPDLESWFELDDAINGIDGPVSYTHEFLEAPERIFYRIQIQ